jgi:hypothetical protein
MKWSRIPNLCWLLTLVTPGSCITLLGVLQSYPELSTLYSYVNSNTNASTNATSLLSNANNFTFLAPSNTAIKNLLASNADALTPDLVNALLQYSLLNGGYPSLSFTNESQFVASNLNNASYANVTGGQAVELVLGADGEPNIVTGNKSISTAPGTVRRNPFLVAEYSLTLLIGTRLRRRIRPHNRRSPHHPPNHRPRNHRRGPRILHLHPQRRRLPQRRQCRLRQRHHRSPRRHIFHSQFCRRARECHQRYQD